MNYLIEIAHRIRAKVPPHLMPADADGLLLTYAVLVRSRGIETTAENVHDAWTAWMVARGEDHPSMIPFADLAPSVQDEDEPFVIAIRQVAKEIATS